MKRLIRTLISCLLDVQSGSTQTASSIVTLALCMTLHSEPSYPNYPLPVVGFHTASPIAGAMQVPQVTCPDSSSACKAVKMWPTTIFSL